MRESDYGYDPPDEIDEEEIEARERWEEKEFKEGWKSMSEEDFRLEKASREYEERKGQ